MKKQMVAIGILAALAGCASTQTVDGDFAGKPGAQVSPDGRGNQYFNSARFDYQIGTSGPDDLQYCIASNVDNRGVSLAGETASYISPFTGIRYSNRESRETSGGQVVTFASGDGGEVVANGTTQYQMTSGIVPIDRAVRYRLNARTADGGLSLIFDSLEQAQLDTGASANTGFNRIGAWSGGGASYAYDSLQRVATSVRDCMASR